MAARAENVDALIMSKARTQFGLITLAQARKRGLTDPMRRRRLDDGRLLQTSPNTLAVAAVPHRPERRLLVAQFEAGPTAVLSHGSAAALLPLHGHALADEATSIHLTVPYGTRIPVGVKAQVHRSRRLAPSDVRRRTPLRFTDPTRTLLDLAPGLTERRLHDLVDVACRDGLISLPHANRRLADLRGNGVRGAGRLGTILAESTGPSGRRPGSWLEREAYEQLVRAGVATPERQVRFHVDGRTFYVDLLLRGPWVAIEPEGWDPHARLEHRAADAERTTLLSGLGLRVVPVTYPQLVYEPERWVAEIAALVDAGPNCAAGEAVPSTGRGTVRG